ncbi:hypothetical protein AYI70_g7174 [Smittium culicis]|uniref:Uncharacterized protein n=1 Tax=Smittium culicis TaxID=133412 RepID=A0A1R1XLU9_9FUNG|nr:hypothetical protein AYI70_g7174 [Smittium culicis]
MMQLQEKSRKLNPFSMEYIYPRFLPPRSEISATKPADSQNWPGYNKTSEELYLQGPVYVTRTAPCGTDATSANRTQKPRTFSIELIYIDIDAYKI